MQACAARSVVVHPATGANTLAVAEYVIASAMMLRRGAYRADAAMLAGDWPRAALMGRELAGATMGLVGYGAIARAVAARARDLGMTVAAYDPHVAADDPAWVDTDRLNWPDLLACADILSLHVPLTDATRHLIDAKALATMTPGAIVINTARGGVVDEPALADALRAGHIGGAALDVFETEPLTAEAARVFTDLPTVLLTPHIAGVTQDANIRVSALTVANVRAVLEGQ
jgi:(S)-sulfolactate dehydrogenase